ncbi:hypothetical protein SNE25_03880 [Mucilaginibacter sabulilitoris]|uniref:Lipocalin-like domain-containing protein n=1 Tax=Mucilaginibacter sabulilitoris TaxID=1173583 RepID=A0ABZ0TP49_9SPHI|nr:hypothetical protein [Mucilaginibacter sabulilitoris]WPU94659.1 hypothetical protein SNE25_03880 [Mucilaginibacter sabulilitoris]
MKKLFPVVLICLFLFSCKKDKDNNPDTSASIVGTWTINSSTISYYDKNGTLLGIDSTQEDKVVFKSDGTITGTLSEDDSEKTTYTLTDANGKKNLKVTTDDGHGNVNSTTYEVVSLTNHNLDFKSDNLYDGIPDKYNGVYYTKVILELKASR